MLKKIGKCAFTVSTTLNEIRIGVITDTRYRGFLRQEINDLFCVRVISLKRNKMNPRCQKTTITARVEDIRDMKGRCLKNPGRDLPHKIKFIYANREFRLKLLERTTRIS